MKRSIGTRKIGGRYFILAGRGTRENCVREAAHLRKRYRYVRIVPWNPFFDAATRALLDDFAIYVFEEVQ